MPPGTKVDGEQYNLIEGERTYYQSTTWMHRTQKTPEDMSKFVFTKLQMPLSVHEDQQSVAFVSVSYGNAFNEWINEFSIKEKGMMLEVWTYSPQDLEQLVNYTTLENVPITKEKFEIVEHRLKNPKKDDGGRERSQLRIKKADVASLLNSLLKGEWSTLVKGRVWVFEEGKGKVEADTEEAAGEEEESKGMFGRAFDKLGWWMV